MFKSKHTKREEYTNLVKELIIDDEIIEQTFPTGEYFLCLTNKRILLVEESVNIKEPSKNIITISYKNISDITLMKYAFGFDELKINTINSNYKVKFMRNECDINEVYKKISKKIL